jgi:hypothetical protein
MWNSISVYRPLAFALGCAVWMASNPTFAQITLNGAASGAHVEPLRRQIPWFKDPDLLAHVHVNKRQYSRLEADYNRLWTRYDAALRALDAELAEDARRARIAEIEREFDDSFTRSLDSVITDERDRRRYEQLYRQYQGYGIFRDSALREQLNLSSDQLEQLLRYDRAWNEEVAEIRAAFAKDRPSAMRKLKHARHRMEKQIASTLSPEQQVVWKELIGEPYEFSPSVYFPPQPEPIPQRTVPAPPAPTEP